MLGPHSTAPRNGALLSLSRGFLFLLGTQFCGALNDNFLRYFLSFSVALGGVWAGELGTGGQGWVGLAMAVPFLLISGIAGRTADRNSKTDLTNFLKKVEVGIVLLAGCALYLGSLSWTFAAFVLLATQSACFGPSKYGLIPELIRLETLSRANGWINATTNLSTVIGMGIAGPLYLFWAEEGGTWAPGAILFFLAWLGLQMAKHIPHQPPSAPGLSPDAGLLRPYQEAFTAMLEGPGLLVAGCWAGFYLLAGLALLFLPDWPALLGVSAATGGLLLAILGGSIGIGSALAGHVSGKCIRTDLIPLGAAGMAIAFLLMGTLTPTFPTTASFLVLGGLSSGFYVVPLQAALQRLAPNEKRGRFLGAANMLSWTAIALASLIFLLLRRSWGIPAENIPTAAGLVASLGLLLALPGPRAKLRQATLPT